MKYISKYLILISAITFIMCLAWFGFNMLITSIFGYLGDYFCAVKIFGYINIIVQGIFLFVEFIKNKDAFTPVLAKISSIKGDSNE